MSVPQSLLNPTILQVKVWILTCKCSKANWSWRHGFHWILTRGETNFNTKYLYVCLCVYCICLCSSPVRHRWVWEEPSAVPWRWLYKHGGQLPVRVPRGTRDRARWVGLSRWVLRRTLLLWTFSSFLLFSFLSERQNVVFRLFSLEMKERHKGWKEDQ